MTDSEINRYLLPRNVQGGSRIGRFSDNHELPVLLSRIVTIAVVAILSASLTQVHAVASETVSTKPDIALSQSAFPADINAYPDVLDYLAHEKPARALAALHAHLAEHENDPRYFNLVGVIALKVPDYASAAAAFERVVVMQPENAGAWLDLAIATAELGNTVSALGYFNYIEAEFDPPVELRAIIADYRGRLAARTKVKSPWQYQVQAFAGVDSNANSGLQNSIIPLTFGAERVDMLLDPAYQARRDSYTQLGAEVSYKHQVGSALLEVGMGMRQRLYQHEHDFSTLDTNLSVGMQRPTAVGDTGLWMHLEHLSLGDKSLLRNVRAVAQVERPYAGCRVGLSAETEWRRYITLTTLNSNVLWGQAGVACDWSLAQVITQTTLIGRVGLDRPTGNRAGGETRRAELIAQIGVPLAWGARAELSTTLSTARDTEGYSPLLEQNAVRRLDRRNIRLLLTLPFGGSSNLMFMLEDNRFNSNLSLFQQNGQSVSIGLRHRF